VTRVNWRRKRTRRRWGTKWGYGKKENRKSPICFEVKVGEHPGTGGGGGGGWQGGRKRGGGCLKAPGKQTGDVCIDLAFEETGIHPGQI